MSSELSSEIFKPESDIASMRCSDSEVDEVIHLLQLLLLYELHRVESLGLSGKAHRELTRVKARDRSRPHCGRLAARPRLFGRIADGTYQSDAGYYYSSLLRFIHHNNLPSRTQPGKTK